ncbi:MAG: DNA polymerase [Synergistaceae bacterium]|nr:DNA polymerase [Synergistaceae bacterium]
MKKQMLLIDGHGLAYRGFYALPENLASADGTPTNAILGFMNMLMKALEEWPSEGLGIFFDAKGPTKRHELFENYKEGRKPTPESFKVQLPLIVELCAEMGLPVFMREGVEADDCIVSTAAAGARDGWGVKILSADKDLFQVINGDIEVIRPSRGVTDFGLYDEENFKEKYGFEPRLMADYLALVGDAVDNIPGVRGIGDKTAKELVGKFGALEWIYENLDSVAKARRGKLEEHRELAFRSRELIVPQPPEPVRFAELAVREPRMDELLPLCRRLGLKKLLERFADGTEPAAGEEAPSVLDREIRAVDVSLDELLASDNLAIAPAVIMLGGFALADREGRTANLDLSSVEDVEKFRGWSEHGTLTLYGCRTLMSLYTELPLPPFERIHDIEIVNYLLHPDRGGLKGIARAIGGVLPEDRELALRLFDLYEFFDPDIKRYGLDKVMLGIDLPLSRTLAKMYRTGIHADAEMLSAVEAELSRNIAAAEADIESYVGEKINLSSPKQVSQLLFERLMLPPIKKNHRGYSTDAYVLEELSKLPEPLCVVPQKIINHREESKVQTGFVQPFLKLSREGGGLIHSTFDHLATGTGRLASKDPNVQNMPVFGDWADRFRACFTPRGGDSVFVAADYSQIELRVLADLPGEEKLIQAFRDGNDIHMETASWVFGLPSGDITPEQRRFAKVVNFGLIYGMSAFGLAQRLGIPRNAAAQMVDKYFSVLPKVQKYMSDSVSEAKARGYTVSHFGRIRPLSEVATIEGRGNNPLNRVAVNTPLQSTAADIAKVALFRFDEALEREFPTAKTVLQIHDSIICECRRDEAEAVEKLLVKTMEAVDILKVPLKAEPKLGLSLKEV